MLYRQILSCSVLLLGCVQSLAASDIPPELQQLQTDLSESLDNIRDAVVGVSDGMGIGSGVVISADGYVLTASHVVSGRSGFRRRGGQRGSEIRIFTNGGGDYKAKMLGRNADADAALLKITDPPPGPDGFPAAKMGKTSETKIGQWCFAVGHPGGYDRTREAPVRIGRILSVGSRTIISDCAILLGDSGGPLFNLQGEVIGIHSMITSLIIENRHVAIDCFHNDWDRLLIGESWGTLRNEETTLIESPFFGAIFEWVDFVPTVRRTVAGSPAEKAGLLPGDQLLSIAGSKIADRLDLGTTLDLLEDNQTVRLTVSRDQQEQQVSLQTGIHPSAESKLDEDLERAVDRQREREIRLQLSDRRPIGRNEKRAPEKLKLYSSLAQEQAGNVVAIRDNGLPICLGTVMTEDGYILTKASELNDAIRPEVVFPLGGRATLTEVARDVAFDLALLKVDVGTRRVTPTVFREPNATVGELALIQDPRGRPSLPTVVSRATHEMPNSQVAFLGVLPRSAENGVRIEQIVAGGAAQRNGLKVGDILLSLGRENLRTAQQLIGLVQRYSPGDEVTIRYMRDEEIATLELQLTPRFTTQALLPLYDNMEMDGQFASRHAGGFPRVLEIDADVYPTKVGGPLLALNGEALGIVIARADRYPAYVIPADSVREVFEKLMAKAMARADQQDSAEE